MLHLWVEKLGIRATGNELERALKKIGRDDVIDRCIYNRTNEISAVTGEQLSRHNDIVLCTVPKILFSTTIRLSGETTKIF